MKKILVILLVFSLMMISSCIETDDVRPALDIEAPEDELDDPFELIGEWTKDPTGTFSYLSFRARGDTRPFFDEAYEFPDNRFIYETKVNSLHDVRMYGYMDTNFIKLSDPISLDPNIFFNGLARITTEEGSYVVDVDFNEINELAAGCVMFNDALLKVMWTDKPIANPFILTGPDLDDYLVPYKVMPSKDNMYTFPVYGFKEVSDAFSEHARPEDFFVIEPFFEEARMFHDGLAAVKQNGKWGYIDTLGNVVIDFTYNDANDFSCGVGAVSASKTSKGHLSLDYTYDRWGLIDDSGRLLTDLDFTVIGNFTDGIAYVEYSDFNKAYINTEGELITRRYSNGINMNEFHEGLAMIDYGGTQYFDTTGKRVFDQIYRGGRDFCDGLAAVKTSSSGKWGYIDKSGSFAIQQKYFYAFDFSRGFARVYEKLGNPACLIDKYGNKYLEALDIKGISKFNEDGYALAYTVMDLNETTQDTLYYMIHIENPVQN